ncbi:STAS domain-containing protein [Streptomyces fulvorobeus]|uniref:Anti-anti-sigma factor n=1 Tax=Streptomyces fulvorobeus TaxID=284028 RepID=A0A7J0CF15_9ACTN|nr:STAS domain-containing protein [Streptomyces fulvorobeus]NYE44551.1 anti-anti-sigma factor [Streptomyces fulvorobeus]GFN01090.1 hypothetical protein Sfulv_59000 [Streptomyces fulvorobeus]
MPTVRKARHRSGRAGLRAFDAEFQGECLLYAEGEFDADTTSSLVEVLEEVRQERVRRIVVDCSAVTFADVAFLRALLDVSSGDTQVVLAAPSLALRRLLRATETVGRLPTVSDADSAVTT